MLKRLEKKYLLVGLVFSCAASGHNHLSDPLPTRKLVCRKGGMGSARDCPGPCPIDDGYGRPNPVTKDRPSRSYRRGQMANIRWTMNNHVDGSGIVRLALVPVEQMYDHGAHDKFAFQYLCMNAGLHVCPDRSYNSCGNDFSGRAWQAKVRIPTSYPDGVYVLGWSWFGGGNFREDSFFGDYYSCSFVKIRGGVRETSSYAPVYDGKKCTTATNRLGVCHREPCRIGKTKLMAPSAFENGKKPTPIQRAWITGASSRGGGASGAQSGDIARGATFEKDVGGDSSRGRRIRDVELTLIDLANSRRIALASGGVFRLRDFRRGVSLVAETKGGVRFVEFVVDSTAVRREYEAPYAIGGDRGGRLFRWTPPTGRSFKVRAYGEGASGSVESDVVELRFN